MLTNWWRDDAGGGEPTLPLRPVGVRVNVVKKLCARLGGRHLRGLIAIAAQSDPTARSRSLRTSSSTHAQAAFA